MLGKILCLSFAISFDGFVAGMNYSSRKICMPFWSLVVVGAMSGAVLTLSLAGASMLNIMNASGLAGRVGGGILAYLGITSIRTAVLGRRSQHDELFCLRLKPVGLVIQILRDPSCADIDSSGVINPKEAVALGVALSIDALGAGFGFFLGQGPRWEFWLLPVLAAVLQPAAVLLGLLTGRLAERTYQITAGSLIAAGILTSIGLLKIAGVE